MWIKVLKKINAIIIIWESVWSFTLEISDYISKYVEEQEHWIHTNLVPFYFILDVDIFPTIYPIASNMSKMKRTWLSSKWGSQHRLQHYKR